MVSRRVIQTILGLIWLIDGIFQLKPQMFTSAFVKQVILSTAQGQPHWVASIVNGGANLVIGHIVIWNALFAAVQILLGLAFIFNFKIKSTITLSIVWSIIVWAFGEGFGQILTWQSLLVNGSPGAAVIYALIGGAIWPAKEGPQSNWNKSGIRFAQISLAVLLILGGLLHLQPTYLTPKGLSQALSVSWAANAITHQGTVISLILAVIEVAIAVMWILRRQLRVAVWSSVILSLIFWWIGQSFGQITDPLATDFNSGLLLAILAISAAPQALSVRGTAPILNPKPIQ